jgi:hypothetical protein
MFVNKIKCIFPFALSMIAYVLDRIIAAYPKFNSLNEINGIYQPSSNAETKENGAIDLSPFGSTFEL